MRRYRVTRCICHNRSFEEIREHARSKDIRSVEALQEEGYCSCGCGLCAPYVEQVLATGKTGFEPGEFYRNRKGNGS